MPRPALPLGVGAQTAEHLTSNRQEVGRSHHTREQWKLSLGILSLRSRVGLDSTEEVQYHIALVGMRGKGGFFQKRSPLSFRWPKAPPLSLALACPEGCHRPPTPPNLGLHQFTEEGSCVTRQYLTANGFSGRVVSRVTIRSACLVFCRARYCVTTFILSAEISW